MCMRNTLLMLVSPPCPEPRFNVTERTTLAFLSCVSRVSTSFLHKFPLAFLPPVLSPSHSAMATTQVSEHGRSSTASRELISCCSRVAFAALSLGLRSLSPLVLVFDLCLGGHYLQDCIDLVVQRCGALSLEGHWSGLCVDWVLTCFGFRSGSDWRAHQLRHCLPVSAL